MLMTTFGIHSALYKISHFKILVCFLNLEFTPGLKNLVINAPLTSKATILRIHLNYTPPHTHTQMISNIYSISRKSQFITLLNNNRNGFLTWVATTPKCRSNYFLYVLLSQLCCFQNYHTMCLGIFCILFAHTRYFEIIKMILNINYNI